MKTDNPALRWYPRSRWIQWHSRLTPETEGVEAQEVKTADVQVLLANERRSQDMDPEPSDIKACALLPGYSPRLDHMTEQHWLMTVMEKTSSDGWKHLPEKASDLDANSSDYWEETLQRPLVSLAAEPEELGDT
ncbi:hypothetical protein TREES_T100008866 [Tupaia chinensis]|uniref:Uncharacterized protein n=1 Tax=Tupaia chinensis TaxID=246437 RepID=L9L089_TUPCH|nr:hypothetical protein TREES_T100008866 [Tupaia chinensis]